ncbi:MAG: ATP-binding protein [Deltaproteobacteria bacterium]|nr:ATP-binding protein [Deltaproteobacteria bacterium]
MNGIGFETKDALANLARLTLVPDPGEEPRGENCSCEDPSQCPDGGWISIKQDQRQVRARCKPWQAWRAAEKMAEKLASTKISKRFRTRTFDSFRATPANRGALEACRRWVTAYPQEGGEGISLVGDVGRGKTHLAAAMVNALHRQGVKVLFAYVPDLIADFRAGISKGTVEDLAEEVMQVPVLVLDDIGAERATEWVQELIPRIINRRYEDLLPTIVTSNLMPDELSERITARAASRLTEMNEWIALGGPDYRVEKRLGKQP